VPNEAPPSRVNSSADLPLVSKFQIGAMRFFSYQTITPPIATNPIKTAIAIFKSSLSIFNDFLTPYSLTKYLQIKKRFRG